MAQKIRIAIVGAGGISGVHASSWQESGLAEIAAVVDTSEGVRQARGQQWGVPAFETITQATRAVPLDLADICTSEHVHYSTCMEALETGLPVFSEKIMAASLPEGLSMLRRANDLRRWTGIDYNYHAFPALELLHELVHTGNAGAVRVFNLNTHSFCFHHLLEAVLWIFGLPARVSAAGTERDWPQGFYQSFKISEDLIYIAGSAFSGRLEYDNGLVINLTASYHQSLNSLPFHYLAFFDNGQVLQASGLDWEHEMVGRVNWLPDKENLVCGSGERGNAMSFKKSIGQVAQRFLRGEPAPSTWKDGWNVMVLDYCLLLAGRNAAPVDVSTVKQSLEAQA